MISRRNLLSGALSLAVTGGTSHANGENPSFVRVQNGRFVRGGKPYFFVGTNMWYGAYLGASVVGRARLTRELDTLAGLGVRNIRLLGAAEFSPLKHSLRPAIHDKNTILHPEILKGLDFCLAELARRDMTAVIYLGNFWEWSGGFVTYLCWTNGGHYIDLGDPKHPWPAFADFSAGFYRSDAAVALYQKYVSAIVSRINTVTHKPYASDPAIMAWQLANEPRPGGSMATAQFVPMYHWAASTAALIKKHDPNHLVCAGNEGIMGCLNQKSCVEKLNSLSGIDYLTFHVWPMNWGWLKVNDMQGSFDATLAKSRDYITAHLRIAAALVKPAVAEEFGLPRDDGSFAPTSSTHFRDRYYKLFFDAVERDATSGGPFAGTNFWAWGGAGRAQHADFTMRAGDTSYTGDPPQEPQGQNSVFNRDTSTLRQIAASARNLT